MKVICKQCGKEFELSNSEMEFYKSKNLELPKRCKECREHNKRNGSSRSNGQAEQKQTVKAEQPVEQNMSSNYTPKEETSKGPKKTVYGVVAAVVVAIAALIGSYFGLDLGAIGTSGSETASSVQTEKFDNKQETATTKEENDNTSSVDTKQNVEDKTETHNLTFRNDNLLQSHYQKHGIEMEFSSAEEYEAAANKVLDNAATLHKTEAEDGDAVYYLEETNEFVVVSTDGYLRTYFNPSGGLEYYNRQ